MAKEASRREKLPRVALDSVWTRLDGLKVFARVALAAENSSLTPLVFVHGLSVSSRYMVPTAQRLAHHRRIYMPDLPGFGASEDPKPALDIPQLGSALVRWMDMWSIEKAIMIGNSLGCQVIADVAVRFPDRLSGAVLTGPTMDTVGRNAVEQARRLAVDIPRESLPCIVTQSYDYMRAGPRRTLATLRYALSDPVERKLPHIQVPILVVRGSRDPIATERWTKEMTRLLPNAQRTVIHGGAHVVTYDKADELTRAVLAFLEQHAL